MKLNLTPEKLATLSKEQKLKLLDLIEEKKRRDRLRPNKYRPNAGQMKVHRSTKLNRFSFSGNGFGKSCLLVNEVIWAAEGYNPIHKEFTHVPCRIMVVLDQPTKVAESWLPELRKWTVIDDAQLHKDGKPFVSRITWPNGSSLVFAFHDQDALRLEGIELDFIVFDEPCGKNLFISLQRAGRTKGRRARYLFGGTPIAAAWLRQDIYQPWSRGELPDVECFKGSTEENKENLAEGYIERFGMFLSDKEKEIRLRGEFFDLQGRGLAHLFKRATHCVSPHVIEEFKENHWPCAVALDPHVAKKTHAVLLGASPDGDLYVLKELALKEVPRQFARSLKEWADGFRIIDWVCDSLGSAELSGGEGFLSFIEVLKSEGIRVRATSYDDKSDEAFMERIQEGLFIDTTKGDAASPRLKIVEACKGTITDIEEVEFIKVKHLDMYKPKLNITNTDFLSCLKYALATNLRFNKTNSTIISTTRPVSWAERNQPTATDRRFSRAQVKRNYTDGRNKAPDEDF